jgi:hypothetical protein
MKKILFFLFILGAGLYLYNQQGSNLAPTPTTDATPTPEITEFIQENTAAQLVLTASQSGQTALELLEEKAEIETKDYGEAGMFITSINGVAGDNKHYWAFYVNDEFAQQGVSQTVLESNDIVKFIYEEIDQAEL